MVTLLEQLHARSHIASLSAYSTCEAAEAAIRQGHVTIRIASLNIDLNFDGAQLIDSPGGKSLAFTGYYRLGQHTVYCRLEVSRATLQGWLQLADTAESDTLNAGQP